MFNLVQRYQGLRFRVVDLATLGYIGGLGVLVVFFAPRVPEWKSIFLIHALFVVAALEAIRASERNPESRLLALPRVLYPAFVIAYGFFEIAKVQHMFAGDNWATEYLVAVDVAIFGDHPTVLARSIATDWLDEFMSFFRVAYYVVPFAILFPLLLKRRHEAIMAGAAGVILVYAVNYVLFMIFPAVNPRMVPEVHALHGADPSGFFFMAIEHAIQGEHGTVVGAAFPSAHTSGTIAWTLFALRYFQSRWPGLVLVFISVGTALATVYLGYHHATDPIAGIILPLVVWPIAMRLVERRGECPLRGALTAPVPAREPAPVPGVLPLAHARRSAVAAIEPAGSGEFPRARSLTSGSSGP